MTLVTSLKSLVKPADVTYESIGGVIEEKKLIISGENQGHKESEGNKGLSAHWSACRPGGSDIHIRLIKSPEKHFRTAATGLHMPNKFYL